MAINAGKLSRAQIKDRARRGAGEVDGVDTTSIMDHEAYIVLRACGGQLVAILRAAKAIDIVARVQIDGLIGPHPVRVHR